MSLPRLLLRLLLGRRLPVASGELRVSGLNDAVTIRRDKWGVLHIDAASEMDAWFALGFCTAQDRGGQLEVLWRVGRGRLAEWVGTAALAADRVSRRIGFYRSAVTQFPVLGEIERAILTAYTKGINAGFAVGLPKPPHEFAILGGTPSRWEPTDVLAVLKLQTFMLPSNWDVELSRLRLLLADGPNALRDLDPVPLAASQHAHPALRYEDFASRLSEELAALQRFIPRGGGSNNWTIAGTRTTTGKPLLASDPHLAPSAPAPWYLAHIRTSDWEVTGAGLVGTPGFPIGHNGFAAWGVTAGLTDNTDFFIESFSEDGTSVREADGTFVKCESVREVIRVKKAADIVEDVLLTPRGPVLTSAVTGVPFALSLRTVWLDPLPVSGFLRSHTAKSFDEFRRCFDAWPAMPLNVLYADANGTIGWQLVGQLPQRRGGSGMIPRSADAADSGWEKELIPFERMPFAVNPVCGYLATANDEPDWASGGRQPPDSVRNRGADAPRSPMLGNDFVDPYRADTIRDELGKRTDWDVTMCGELQQSVRSMPWEEIRDIVLSLASPNANARDALELLRAWDGNVAEDSSAATIFELFIAEMCVRVAKAKAPNGWLAALGEVSLGDDGHSLFADRRVGHLVRLLREQPAGWFSQSWSDVMLEVLGGVVQRLRKGVGPGPDFWVWGNVRQLKLTHPLFAKSRLLGPAFNLDPVPIGGDANTISQAGCRPADPTAFTHNMANLRTVFDLADLSRSTFVLCGGQSGNPCSPHFADQFTLWQNGESIVMPFEQPAVIRAAKDVLRLVPDSPKQTPSARG